VLSVADAGADSTAALRDDDLVTAETQTDAAAPLRVLDEHEWRARAEAHADVVDAWTAGRRGRRSRGERHPVDDFLFEYYPTRPSELRRWHPGLGVALVGADHLRSSSAYRFVDVDGTDALTVDASSFSRRRDGMAWVEGLLRSTTSRPAQLGCFGLHEWAMVYGLRQDEVRHESWPLRLDPAAIRATVDEQGLRCTHYDAFRFFTPEAARLNDVTPTRALQPELDQPGCLHATMDLYKWASKYVELVGSDLVADCFDLARDTRSLDMEAAPYDLAELGMRPVTVETPSGRAEYVRRQRGIAERAVPLRARLSAALGEGLAAIDAAEPGAARAIT
jgi:hypothetical protein